MVTNGKRTERRREERGARERALTLTVTDEVVTSGKRTKRTRETKGAASLTSHAVRGQSGDERTDELVTSGNKTEQTSGQRTERIREDRRVGYKR